MNRGLSGHDHAALIAQDDQTANSIADGAQMAWLDGRWAAFIALGDHALALMNSGVERIPKSC